MWERSEVLALPTLASPQAPRLASSDWCLCRRALLSLERPQHESAFVWGADAKFTISCSNGSGTKAGFGKLVTWLERGTLQAKRTAWLEGDIFVEFCLWPCLFFVLWLICVSTPRWVKCLSCFGTDLCYIIGICKSSIGCTWPVLLRGVVKKPPTSRRNHLALAEVVPTRARFCFSVLGI